MAKKKGNYQEELDKKFKPFYDYIQTAHTWRGEIINKAIDLEQVMEAFIAKHYVLGKTQEVYDQRTEDFKRMFFWETNMGFGNKMQIVKNIILINHPEFLQLDHIQNFEKDFEDIIKCRNSMAHWQLEISKEYIWSPTKKIKVNKLKAGNENVYSEEEINRIAELCRKYTTVLLHWGHIPFEDVLSS
jgi:hypothetical protein